MKIYFETYGCTANQNNTEIMKGLVIEAGHKLSTLNKTEIIVINTCIVKGPTENKIRRRIQDLEKVNKPIILAGCMPEIRANELKGKNLYFLGIKQVLEIDKLIESIVAKNYEKQAFLTRKKEIKVGKPKLPNKEKIGITQISEGCNGNCTFCTVRLAKGSLFSYPENQIIKNIKEDLNLGCNEVWITSQDNASYGLDKGQRKLPELIKKILSLSSEFKVRIGMMNPENVIPIINNLIEIYKHNKVKKFLHIPIQSGSDRMLKAMNRKYSVSDFVKIIKKFRAEIPSINISTDIIVGFPGETDRDFEDTLKIFSEISPNMVNISRYWPMKGTPAASLPQIDTAIVKKRTIKLMNKYKELKHKK